MADESGRSGQSGDEQRNLWAPPGSEGSQPGKSASRPGKSASRPEAGEDVKGRSVADQPTVTGPGGMGAGIGPPPIPPAPSAPSAPPGAQGGQAAHPGQQGYPGQAQPGPSGYAAPGYGQGHDPYAYGGPGPASGPASGPAPGPAPGAAYGYPAAPPPYGAGMPGAPGAPGAYGYGGGPYGGGYGWGGPPLPTGMSVASMVLGIISLVLVFTCWGSFLGIITAPVALGLGVSARRKVDRGELGGRGQATSGLVMGVIGTVASALVVVLIVLMFTVWADEIEESDPGTGPGGSSIDARGSVALVMDR
ncbi:DUF4190 domain-containing protein [Streptomyces sp. NPDC054796]